MAVIATASVALANGDGKNSFKADLNGYNEVVGPGSISTTGHGIFRARIDEGSQTISYTLTYAEVENPVTQAHVHFAQRHVGGGVIYFLCGGGDKPPCPSPGGTVTGVVDAADIIGPNGQGIEAGSFAEAVRAMRAGATYANVHSTRWPAGEIRGQLRSGRND
ncbi:MAG: CHRD domain-containing protein [Gaiellaceae bacterium]